MRRARTLGRILCLGGSLLCAGCALNIAHPAGDATRVITQLNAGNDKQYTLQTSSGKSLDTAVAQGKELVFTLPLEGADTACLQVVDQEGKVVPIAESTHSSFENRTWLEYLEARRGLQEAQLQEKKRELILEHLRRSRKELESRLRTNVAYKGEECVKPPMGRLPERPAAACSAEEAENVATALCLASSGMSEACSLAASEFGSALDINVRNFLSNPACGKMVADFLGDPYTTEDFVGDLGMGFGEDIVGGLLESDSLADNFLGLLGGAFLLKVKVDQFNDCVAGVSGRCYSKYRAWETERTRIAKLPDETLAACQSDVAWARWASSAADAQPAGLDEKRKDVARIEDRLQKIEARGPSALPNCMPASAATTGDQPAPAEPPTVYRIGIAGRNAESFSYNGKSYNYGVRIGDVTPGTPAAAAGLQPGDVLFQINEKVIRDMDFFVDQVHRSEGQELDLTLLRDGSLWTAKLRPAIGKLLIGLQAKDTLLGPQITEVTKGMPAAGAGLRAGDIILLVNGTVIDDVGRLQRALFESVGATVGLIYLRGEETSLVAVTPIFVSVP